MNSASIFNEMYEQFAVRSKFSWSILDGRRPILNDRPIHLHDFYEIRILLIPGKKQIDHIDIILPNVSHQSMTNEENLRAHVLGIGNDFTFARNFASDSPVYFTSPYSTSLLIFLRNIVTTDCTTSKMEEGRLLLSLLFFSAVPGDQNGTSESRVKSMATYFQNFYYRHDLTVEKTSRHFGFSPKYVQQLFCAAFGMPPKKYLEKIRMTNAVLLLRKHRYYIGEIASLCGYNNPHYFTNVFHRYYGCSPHDFLGNGDAASRKGITTEN